MVTKVNSSQKAVSIPVDSEVHPVTKLAKMKLPPGVPPNLPVRFFKDIKAINFSLLAMVNKINYLIGANFSSDKERMNQFSERMHKVLHNILSISQKMSDSLRGRKDFSDKYYDSLVKFHSVIQKAHEHIFIKQIATDLSTLDVVEENINKNFELFKNAFREESSKLK